jgi:hypothetical protein
MLHILRDSLLLPRFSLVFLSGPLVQAHPLARRLMPSVLGHFQLELLPDLALSDPRLLLFQLQLRFSLLDPFVP